MDDVKMTETSDGTWVMREEQDAGIRGPETTPEEQKKEPLDAETARIKLAELYRARKTPSREQKEEPAKTYDAGKPRLHLVPPMLEEAIARVLDVGKYDDFNWQHGMSWTRSYNSARRHLNAWIEGEDLDPETGQPHLAHALTRLMFLLWYAEHRPDFDDRRAR